MRRPARLTALLLGLAALLVALSGCVYLRLLTVKNQLRDFDAHFAVGGRPSWFLEFKSRPLYAKDAVFLIGAPPLSVSTTTAGQVYAYEFEMFRSTPTLPTAMEHLSLRLHMVDGRLSKIEVPETFLLFFSRRVVEESFRQAKDAEVLKLQKTARATIKLLPETDAELPSLSRTRLLMGEPLSTSTNDQGESLLSYRYRILGDKRGIPIALLMTFSPTGEMRRTVITWDTSTVDATFVRP